MQESGPAPPPERYVRRRATAEVVASILRFVIPVINSDLNIDESTAPQLEAHEREYRVATVDFSLPVLIDQRTNRARVKEPAAAQYSRVQRVLHQWTQLMPQPPPQRRTESALRPKYDVVR